MHYFFQSTNISEAKNIQSDFRSLWNRFFLYIQYLLVTLCDPSLLKLPYAHVFLNLLSHWVAVWKLIQWLIFISMSPYLNLGLILLAFKKQGGFTRLFTHLHAWQNKTWLRKKWQSGYKAYNWLILHGIAFTLVGWHGRGQQKCCKGSLGLCWPNGAS